MSRDYTQECCITICGFERTVEVDFRVTSLGSSDSYWSQGDPPEIEIDAVRDAESGRDITDFCEKTRDLWAANPTHSEGWFNVGHGPARMNPYYNNAYAVKHEPRVYPAWAQITVNAQTLFDTLYEDIIVNHMPEPDMDDFEPDYERSNYFATADTRGEYDV